MGRCIRVVAFLIVFLTVVSLPVRAGVRSAIVQATERGPEPQTPSAVPLTAFANVSPVTVFCCGNGIASRHWVDLHNLTANASGGTPPYTYTWEFGDGAAVSTDRNTTHAYRADGLYTAVLTVADQGGNVATSTVDVSQGPASSVDYVEFRADPALGPAPLDVDFIRPAGSGLVTAYLWTFGDGTSNTTGSPRHTYLRPGVYVASVNVTFSDATHARYATTVLAIGGIPVTTRAVGEVWQSCAPPYSIAADFSAEVGGGSPPYTYDWIFGDGSPSSNLSNPTHSYDVYRGYAVNLTVVDTAGSVASSAVNILYVPHSCPPPAPPPLDVGISYTIVGYCDRDIWNNVSFNASITGGVPPYTYAWDFGDGTPNSTLATPSHSYVAGGSRTVNLTVWDGNGSRGTASVTFIVAPPSCAPRVEPPWIVITVAAAGFGVATAVFLVARRKRRGPP